MGKGRSFLLLINVSEKELLPVNSILLRAIPACHCLYMLPTKDLLQNTFWNGGKVSGYQEWQRFLLPFCFLSSVKTLGQVETRGFWPSFLELDILHHPLGLNLFWLESKQEHTVEISGILICDFVYIPPSEVDENTRIKLQYKPSKVHNKASKLLISSSCAETLETLISLSHNGCWHTFRVDWSWGCGGSSVAAILWGLRR